MKILMVDDDALTRKTIEHMLLNMGCDVVMATNGEEAQGRLDEEAIPIVISDWNMPQLSGIQLCQWIRARQFPWYVYFIILTGRSGNEDIVHALHSGADQILKKPIDRHELEARVRVAQRLVSLESHQIVLFALAKLAESRDPETGEHLDRIREYARILGQGIAQDGRFIGRLPPGFATTLYETSPLHDIGKVGIPDYVLLKPGRLSDSEFDLMKQHTLIGARTLEAAMRMYHSTDYLVMARDIAAAHHEHFDGTGYPFRLEGEKIPIAARVTAVADVYDALVSRRVYREALSHDVARDTIAKGSGTQFDPRVVEVFFRREAELQKVLAEHNDRNLPP